MRSIALALTVAAFLVIAPQAAASPGWRWPVAGQVITPYRNGADPYAGGQHRGIDIAAPAGTPVAAATAGVVTFAGVAGSSGLTVAVRTDDGFDTSYLHLSAVGVTAGERVAAGTPLGAVGTSGRRSAVEPHLHFGVREAGSRFAYRDPLDFLPAQLPAPAPRATPVPVPVGAPVRSEAKPLAALPAVGAIPLPGVGGSIARAALGAGAVAPHPAPVHAQGGPSPSSPPASASLPRAWSGIGATPARGAARAAGATSRAGLSHSGARGSAHTEGRGGASARTGATHAACGECRSRGRPARPPAIGPSAHVREGVRPGHGHRSSGEAPATGAGRRGFDLGWLVACAALVAAATLLGRSAAANRRTPASSVADVRSTVRSLRPWPARFSRPDARGSRGRTVAP